MPVDDPSKLAARVLTDAGWPPQRRVGIERDERALREAGYEVWPALREFLAAYSGLELRWRTRPVRGAPAGLPVGARVDGAHAAEVVDPTWVRHYSSWVGAAMTPFGAMGYGVGLFAAIDGRFFLGEEDGLAPLGDTVEEFFSELVADVHGVLLTVTPGGMRCLLPRPRGGRGLPALISELELLGADVGTGGKPAARAVTVRFAGEEMRAVHIELEGLEIGSDDPASPALRELPGAP